MSIDDLLSRQPLPVRYGKRSAPGVVGPCYEFVVSPSSTPHTVWIELRQVHLHAFRGPVSCTEPYLPLDMDYLKEKWYLSRPWSEENGHGHPLRIWDENECHVLRFREVMQWKDISTREMNVWKAMWLCQCGCTYFLYDKCNMFAMASNGAWRPIFYSCWFWDG